MTYTLAITRLGARGEGLAETEDGRVFIPYALPGDLIRVDVRGERGHLLELLTPSPDRVAPFCPYYAICGGCAVQALAPKPYAEWKRGLVADALRNAGVQVEVAQLIDAHGEGRRRATF
ncbi:MAG TPA: RNA methyltransferase, partial [Beijerinckiaceae bacterium]|nr:RNA methyltransferase [Beijerinckiaceae bacterium]